MTAMACVGFLTAVLGMLVLTVSQPAEVHVAFFFAGFPLTIVPDDEFLPDPRGKQYNILHYE